MFGKKDTNQSESEAANLEPGSNLDIENTKPDGPALESKVIDEDDIFAHVEETREIDYGNQEILEYTDHNIETVVYRDAKLQVFESLIDRFNFNAIRDLTKELQIERILQASLRIVNELGLPLNSAQVDLLRKQIVDDTLGFGPLEKILHDPDVADIMINSSKSVYVEKNGKIFPTDLVFSSERHLINIIQKIVSKVGRRIDEASPMVDARMPDGSRFNAIIPPLALDGALVSIRKFKREKMSLEEYVPRGSLTHEMYKFLSICAASRLNIIISGGTGSGKTTLLNALSGFIDIKERVVTIEDAAELQLKQPHVLRLETRPANMEGAGAITQRHLLKNSLRMRPDRIILGEIRGEEVIDVLQAMNTGHEGSMATIHSNNPRECLTRLENLFSMSGIQMPIPALRQQIANSIHVIVQIARMHDGIRRITSITEILDFDGENIQFQELFAFKARGMGEDGKIQGDYVCNGIKPEFSEQVAYFSLLEEMNQSLGLTE